jgi:peptide-methionine (S)-S-oxide reductase
MKPLILLFLISLAANASAQDQSPVDTAVFAGGCFWCMEPPFDKLEGVIATISGYTGGHVQNPSYQQVVREETGHREAVQVRYNPDIISYQELLTVFWKNIDPLDDGGQFCDRGFSYSTAIWVNSAAQREAAEASKQALNEAGVLPGEIATPILAAETFWPAEQYHQNYYQKNPLRYRYYRSSCGRDDRLETLWGEVNISNVLTPDVSD